MSYGRILVMWPHFCFASVFFWISNYRVVGCLYIYRNVPLCDGRQFGCYNCRSAHLWNADHLDKIEILKSAILWSTFNSLLFGDKVHVFNGQKNAYGWLYEQEHVNKKLSGEYKQTLKYYSNTIMFYHSVVQLWYNG
jgi:hypothetical protein